MENQSWNCNTLKLSSPCFTSPIFFVLKSGRQSQLFR